MQYFISKRKYQGEVVFVNCSTGFKVKPKTGLNYDGIKVESIMIVKPDLIDKVIKRKIRYRLDQYLKLIIDNIDGNNDADDTRRALDDIARYRSLVKERYSLFLDDKYMSLLEKKFDVLERELKSNLLFNNVLIEEKENSRSR